MDPPPTNVDLNFVPLATSTNLMCDCEIKCSSLSCFESQMHGIWYLLKCACITVFHVLCQCPHTIYNNHNNLNSNCLLVDIIS